MSEIHIHTHKALNQYDPSRTTALRNAFSKSLRRKFSALRFLIWQVVVEDDVFGLVNTSDRRVTVFQRPGRRAFAYPRSSDKVIAFMEWLQERIDISILELSEVDRVRGTETSAWTSSYIRAAYIRGISRARAQMKEIGIEPPIGLPLLSNNQLTVYAKPKRRRFAVPRTVITDRLSIIEKQVFNSLKGITKDMAKNISKVLAQGLKNGDNPKTIAKKLNSTIKKLGKDLGVKDSLGRYVPAEVRADLLARTEIIRAHAEAQLQEFKDWGLQGVSVKAEFVTAGDARVCSICAKHEKQVYTIAAARGLIPLHPRCRCIWLPYNVELAKARRKK